MMTFDDITGNGYLWAVKYDGEPDNELHRVFSEWTDPLWLDTFFTKHFQDLNNYFKVTSIEQAIDDTIEDADKLQAVFLDFEGEPEDLEKLFKPLNNAVTSPKEMEKMKARGEKVNRHDSWLRIYAIRLTDGKYIITGGTIKLTLEMKDRDHTLNELVKLDKVRRFLIEEGIVDDEGFIDYLAEIS